MRALQHNSWALISLLLLCACAPQDHDTTTTAPIPGPALDDEAWAAALAEHRTELDEDFRTSPTSPMAGTQYLKSEPGDRVYLTRQEKTFGLASSAVPDAELLVAKQEGTWYWHSLGPDVVCRRDEELVPDGSALEGAAIFAIGELHLSFYPGKDRVTFIAFDPERQEMKSFDHLLYFPPDREYAVSARLAAFSKPDEIDMLTSRNLKKTFYRYAKIEFRLGGQDQELSAFKSSLTGAGSEYLFIPFRDATTGRETYGAGRFLEIDEPENEHFVLDFNRAFNPLCNYSPAYNCAIPPRENHLEVAIRAGEMTYPH